jgi:peptidoglycan/LPS O-acetylase OafA/YrhL
MTTPGTHRFVALDALRGLCAVFVCLFHFRVNSPVAASRFVLASWQFVDFFFVLSGFVIAANYRDRLRSGMQRRRFLVLRVGRVYPLHVVVLGLFVVTELALAAAHNPGIRAPFDAAHPVAGIPLHLLMLQCVGLLPRLTWNAPAWSIAAEFWAYVGFALVVPVAGRRLDAVLVAVVVACPLILLVATPWGINVTWDWAIVRCFYGFALGALGWSVWQATGRAPATRPGLWFAVEAATAVAIVAFVIVAGPTRWNLLGPPLFAVAVLVFAHERGGLSRVLVTPPLLILGTLSYSIYMVHSFVQARLDDVLKLLQHRSGIPLTTTILHRGAPVVLAGASPLQGTVLVGVMLVAVVAVSHITYRAVERPGQRWARARAKATPLPVSAA